MVIPAHNEEAHIQAVIEGLPSFVDHIILVDDASTDGTASAAESSTRSPILIYHEINEGVGAAVIDGYLKALELGAEVVVRLDGDGQMDPAEMSRLLDPVVTQRVGFAKGNRFILGRMPDSMPATRLLGNIVLTFMTKMASGYWHLFDPQNGYSAISSEAIQTLDQKYLRRCGYFFENALLIELNSAEVPAVDVPTATIYGNETSGVNIGKVAVSFPFKLIRGGGRRLILRYVVRDFSPVVVFLGAGSLMLLGGLIWAGLLWYRSAATGVPSAVGSIMLAALPMLAGFELLVQALVLDINASPR